jgi:nucleolar protein 14
MVPYIHAFTQSNYLGDLDEPVVVRPTEWPEQTRAEQESEPTPKPIKTKTEVMSELIAKSKAYKHERQQQHEEDDEAIDELDADLPILQSLLQTVPQHRPRVEKTVEMLSYDEAIREMVYDKRSKPAERTKTEEEIAQEDSERLQKLEQDRLRRMRGEDVDEEGGLGRREGDDLDDDFVPEAGEENLYGFGKGAAELEEDEVQQDEGLSADEDLPDDVEPPSDGEDESEEEEEDDDDFDIAQYFTDEETGEIPGHASESEDDIIPTTKRLRIQEPTATSAELAYTFPCPDTLDQLHDILKDVPTPSIPIVIERIEILHSTKLLAENRQKLETLTPLVLKLILNLASQKPAPLKTIHALVVRLKGLVTQFPSVLTTEVFAALEASRKRFLNSLAGEKVFPTAQELVLFHTVGQIYPPSDLVHVIVNPTMLFMGQILGQMKIKGVQDLARGLFVATLFLQVFTLSNGAKG